MKNTEACRYLKINLPFINILCPYAYLIKYVHILVTWGVQSVPALKCVKYEQIVHFEFFLSRRFGYRQYNALNSF